MWNNSKTTFLFVLLTIVFLINFKTQDQGEIKNSQPRAVARMAMNPP